MAQDYNAAIGWFRKAAEQGFADAQNRLGKMYAEGDGVAQDYVQAHKWFNLAGASSTDPTQRSIANKNRNTVAAEMSPDQIAEAQRLASTWRKK